jgi:class 3 adenylate cyclase
MGTMQKTAAILHLQGPEFDALTVSRLELAEAVNRNRGLVVKETTDVRIVLFPQPKSAVTCAIELRRLDETSSREQALPALLCSAIAYGPVTIHLEAVSGDAVEIADNLASILEPGDVFVSGSGRRAIDDKLPVDYEPLRENSTTGYRVLVDANEVLSAIRYENPVAPDWGWKIMVPMIAMLTFIAFSWFWIFLPD